jgi:hypothetical protein
VRLRLASTLAALLLAAACASPRPERAAAAPAAPAPAAPGAAQAEYERFAREFLDWHYASNPVEATSLGVHAHDARMPDVSRAGIERRTAELRGWLERLGRIDRAALAGDAALDYQILDHAIRAQLLDVEEVRPWRKDPGFYNSQVAYGISTLSSREFAPLPQRLEAMMARLAALPAILAAARENLDPAAVPRLWAEQAVGDVRGTATFVRDDLQQALAAQGLPRSTRSSGAAGRWRRGRPSCSWSASRGGSSWRWCRARRATSGWGRTSSSASSATTSTWRSPPRSCRASTRAPSATTTPGWRARRPASTRGGLRRR